MISLFYERFIGLVTVPFTNKEAIWVILPLILAVLLMEVYFGRYKLENLGWNTAFSNSLIFIFISMSLLKYLDENGILFTSNPKTVIVFILICVGVLLSLFNYFHIFQKRFAFILSSIIPVNVINYLIVSLVYSDLPIDAVMIIVSVVYATIIYGVIKFIWFLIPESLEEGE